jgi:hypothetical protein
MKTMSISYSYLDNLINEGNHITNLTEFVQTYAINFLPYKAKCNDNGISDESFWHRVGTLLLNAKLSNSQVFGMEYNDMVIVTYQNNSIPNLLKFYLIK